MSWKQLTDKGKKWVGTTNLNKGNKMSCCQLSEDKSNKMSWYNLIDRIHDELVGGTNLWLKVTKLVYTNLKLQATE